MIIYYAVEGYADEGYWVAPQGGFAEFIIPAQNRDFSVPAR